MVAPAEITTGVTWESTDSTVATVSEAGLVTAVKAGTCKIKATSVGFDASGAAVVAELPLTVAALPDAKETTVADLAKITTADGVLYKVKGVIENNAFGVSKSSAYNNNAYLVDPATGDAIMIYGSSDVATALAYASGAVSFTNPGSKLAMDVKDGSLVNMMVLALPYTDYNNKTTPEISGIYVDAVADTTDKFTASVTAGANGTATLDKAADLLWGDTVTVTGVPATGYRVKNVTVTSANGSVSSATVDAADVNKYTFAATCVNKVNVEFEQNLNYTAVATYALATGTSDDGTKVASTDAALALFTGVLPSTSTAVITGCTKASNVYGAAKCGIKFSTSSTPGDLVLTIDGTQAIRKVTATLTGYKQKKGTAIFGGTSVSIGDGTAMNPTVEASVTFDAAISSFEFTADSAAPRYYITSVTFWKVAA